MFVLSDNPPLATVRVLVAVHEITMPFDMLLKPLLHSGPDPRLGRRARSEGFVCFYFHPPLSRVTEARAWPLFDNIILQLHCTVVDSTAAKCSLQCM